MGCAPDGAMPSLQGEIDTAIAEFEAQLGGAEGLRAAFLDSNVPASAIEDQVRLLCHYTAARIERSIYRLAAKTEGPRLVRRGIGRYEAEGYNDHTT